VLGAIVKRYGCNATPFTSKGHNAYGSVIKVRRGSLDGLVQFIEFTGVARPHQTLQSVARNGACVVEIGNTRGGNPCRRPRTTSVGS
jgi:hypothetical protein